MSERPRSTTSVPRRIGAKIEAILSASECVKAVSHQWQHDPRHPPGEFCYVGAMDGLNAMPVLADGSMQTLKDGKTYMRTFLNTEIRGMNADHGAVWAISKSEHTGGFGQPDPSKDEILVMHGAMEMFAGVRFVVSPGGYLWG